MVVIQNFTEFYNLLKTHPNITNSISTLKDYTALVERFKITCSCRGAEKQRLKDDCETRYRLHVTNEVSNNIELFKTSLGDDHFRFIHNHGLIKEF
jgi:hypothetical protein